MKSKIHFFNPGHETAILQGSENYTPPANVQRMIKELSYLPVWYADPGDFVFTEEIVSPRFFSLQPKEFRPFAKLISRKEIEKQKDSLPEMQATPWGLSPHSHSLFEKLRKSGNLNLTIPEWKEEYTRLTMLILSGIMSITDKNAFARRFRNIGTHEKNQSGMEGRPCFR